MSRHLLRHEGLCPRNGEFASDNAAAPSSTVTASTDRRTRLPEARDRSLKTFPVGSHVEGLSPDSCNLLCKQAKHSPAFLGPTTRRCFFSNKQMSSRQAPGRGEGPRLLAGPAAPPTGQRSLPPQAVLLREVVVRSAAALLFVGVVP